MWKAFLLSMAKDLVIKIVWEEINKLQQEDKSNFCKCQLSSSKIGLLGMLGHRIQARFE